MDTTKAKVLLMFLMMFLGCSKEPKPISRIDFLCDPCVPSEERQEESDQSDRARRSDERLSHIRELRGPPTIFEYDVLREELNVRTYEEMFDKAVQFYVKGEIEVSTRIFQVLAENAPNELYREVALFNLAIGKERLGYESEALSIYEKLMKSVEREIREDSTLRAMRILLAQGKDISIDLRVFSDERRRRFARALVLLDGTEKILSELLAGIVFVGITTNEFPSTSDRRRHFELKKKMKELSAGIEEMMEHIISREENETKTILLLCRGNLRFAEAIMIQTTDAESIKAKVRNLLDAQKNYYLAVKEMHPWWMTAGIFKIGETYRYLFEDIASSPDPPEINTDEERQIYRAELLKEIKRALDLAQNIYEKNILFSQRSKFKTIWITKSEEGIAKVRHYADLVQKFVEKVEGESDDQSENSAQ